MTTAFQPLQLTVGKPLRVAVYGSIAQSIRAGRIGLGDLLPTETEIGVALGVSRTVVREAMLLLEEDGLIRTRRGIGRFVADRLPRVGLERLQCIENLFAGPDPVAVRRVTQEVQPASEFIADGLGIEVDSPAWVWESVVEIDGRPAAMSLECVSAAGRFADGIQADRASMLSALLTRSDLTLGPGLVELTAGTAGQWRGSLLGLSRSAPVLVLTQLVAARGEPVYLAKHLLAPTAGTIAVVQAAQN